MKHYKLAAASLGLALILQACGGGGGGSPASSAAPQTPSAPSTPGGNEGTSQNPSGKVTISGQVTFESFAHAPLTHGLDYQALSLKPARGVSVNLLGEGDEILADIITDNDGFYTALIDEDTPVKVRVLAQMSSNPESNSGAPAVWDVQVTDNTREEALYVIEGALASSGRQDQARDLTAMSGWDVQAGDYVDARAAGPFAILDPIYDGIQNLIQLDGAIEFPALNVHWSVNNRSVVTSRSSSALAAGDIGTSFYTEGSIYILGAQDNDTDEYDRHVIAHEWAHYVEDMLSRADTIGGNHGAGDRLDPRVAFSEGLGNAISAMVLGDPVYRDSGGIGQARGFAIDIENNAHAHTGWFNEGSVQSILYDLFDEAPDGIDDLTLGLAPIYAALTDAEFNQGESFATIFSFMDRLTDQMPEHASGFDKLLLAQNIYGRGELGIGETNTGSVSASLPIYKALTIDAPVQVCSHVEAGHFNKLGNRSFVSLPIDVEGRYRITMEQVSGDDGRDPDFFIYRQGELTGSANTQFEAIEIWDGPLESGLHVIDMHDRRNLSQISTAQGNACYRVTAHPL